MEEDFKIIVKQKSSDIPPGGASDAFSWGLEIVPAFEVFDVDFHANTTLEMRGYFFTKVDVLEISGETKGERMQFVVSKSLIDQYVHLNNTHTFILRKSQDVARLSETVFINAPEIPKELQEKLKED